MGNQAETLDNESALISVSLQRSQLLDLVVLLRVEIRALHADEVQRNYAMKEFRRLDALRSQLEAVMGRTPEGAAV